MPKLRVSSLVLFCYDAKPVPSFVLKQRLYLLSHSLAMIASFRYFPNENDSFGLAFFLLSITSCSCFIFFFS